VLKGNLETCSISSTPLGVETSRRVWVWANYSHHGSVLSTLHFQREDVELVPSPEITLVLLISDGCAHNSIFILKKEPFDWPITNIFGTLGKPYGIKP